MKKEKRGRPTKLRPEVVIKLVAGFHKGYNDTQACSYAGISRNFFYSHLKDDDEFRDKIVASKNKVNMRAREVIVDAIDQGDVKSAQWWLSKKSTDEFGSNPTVGNSEPLAELEVSTQDIIDSIEELMCFKYRGVLFLERKQILDEKISKDPNIKTRLDHLLGLDNSKLLKHIELEIYATRIDKADVGPYFEHRNNLKSVLKNDSAIEKLF